VSPKEDIATLTRLQEEFSAELATLRGRVDALEARTAELEANQFSTTTKLRGEAIFNVSQVFGDKRADRDTNSNNNPDLESNAVFSDRVRLTLNSSFFGTDQLQTRLNAGNIVSNAGAGVTNTNMTRLGYDGGSTNAVEIDKLNYAFNFGENIRVKIDATGAELNENVANFNPDFASSGSGALTRYGRFSPIYRQAGDGAGITVSTTTNAPFSIAAGYYSTGRTSGVTTASSPLAEAGLFDGNNTYFGQIGFRPSQAINLGFAFARSYYTNPTNSSGLFYGTGSDLANNPFNGGKIEANHYGVQVSFQPSAKLTIGGWAGYTDASQPRTSNDAEAWYWAANLAVKDFGAEGNVLGLIFGQPPKLTSNDRRVAGVEQRDRDTSYHLEGLYKMKLSDNILLTPGLLVIFNPEHNNNNDTIYVGTLRTTFTF
jgi:hypothetical protein